MAFALPDHLAEFQKSVERLAKDKVEPRAAQIDAADEFPWDLKELFADNDLLALPFAERYGGTGGEVLPFCVAIEEIARASASASMIIGAQCLGSTPIAIAGSEEQKEKYFPRLAKGEIIPAFGLTEPDAGSDVMGIKTTAKHDGDGYLINGSKRFITHGSVADYVVVFAQTSDGNAKKELSCFIVEKDTPGFKASRLEEKMGLHGSPTAELVFEDCWIPQENLVGKEGEGFK